MSNITDQFHNTDSNVFKYRKGKAFVKDITPCHWKLCLTATDELYLAELLYDISKREDCYYVKFSPSGSPKCRDGMFLGRVFLTSKDAIGALWYSLRTDRKIMCSIQDDIAIKKYRK